MTRVYLDHAATTPLDPEVAEAMTRVLGDGAAKNPSSIHAEGQAAHALVEHAREQVAALIGAGPREIVFTSGGTEADNLALRGAVAAAPAHDGIVTAATEHHAVLDTARDLERAGRRLRVLPVARDGRVDPGAVLDALDERTALVSIAFANNEIGTIQPVAEIGAQCRSRGVTFHTDAVQAVGQLALDVSALPVDMVSLDAHKLYGPHGVGALYVRRGTKVAAAQTGGGQERGRRAGTENVAAIVGFGVAMDLVRRRRDTDAARILRLRDRLVAGVRVRVPDAMLTGSETDRLPNSASFAFLGASGEALVVALDLAGFAVSSGSACTSGSTEPSHVLLALGLTPDVARCSLRISLGRSTTEADIDALLDALPPIVQRIRAAASVDVATGAASWSAGEAR